MLVKGATDAIIWYKFSLQPNRFFLSTKIIKIKYDWGLAAYSLHWDIGSVLWPQWLCGWYTSLEITSSRSNQLTTCILFFIFRRRLRPRKTRSISLYHVQLEMPILFVTMCCRACIRSNRGWQSWKWYWKLSETILKMKIDDCYLSQLIIWNRYLRSGASPGPFDVVINCIYIYVYIWNAHGGCFKPLSIILWYYNILFFDILLFHTDILLRIPDSYIYTVLRSFMGEWENSSKQAYVMLCLFSRLLKCERYVIWAECLKLFKLLGDI